MRRLFTTKEATGAGLSPKALRCGEAAGRWRRVRKGVYAEGPEEPTDLDRRVADVLACDGVADGRLAGVLHGLDGVDLDDRRPQRRLLPADRIVSVEGVRCTDGFQTIVDLAADLDDLVWEQALESALRRRLAMVAELELSLARLGRSRIPGTARIPASPGASPARSAAHREPVGDAHGPAGPDGAVSARSSAAVGDRVGQSRPCTARPGPLRRAGRSAAQRSAALRRPPGDGGRRCDRLALRPVHLDRGRAPANVDREEARRPRRPGPAPADWHAARFDASVAPQIGTESPR